MSRRNEYEANRQLAETAQQRQAQLARMADQLDETANDLHTRAADLRGSALELQS